MKTHRIDLRRDRPRRACASPAAARRTRSRSAPSRRSSCALEVKTGRRARVRAHDAARRGPGDGDRRRRGVREGAAQGRVRRRRSRQPARGRQGVAEGPRRSRGARPRRSGHGAAQGRRRLAAGQHPQRVARRAAATAGPAAREGLGRAAGPRDAEGALGRLRQARLRASVRPVRLRRGGACSSRASRSPRSRTPRRPPRRRTIRRARGCTASSRRIAGDDDAFADDAVAGRADRRREGVDPRRPRDGARSRARTRSG